MLPTLTLRISVFCLHSSVHVFNMILILHNSHFMHGVNSLVFVMDMLHEDFCLYYFLAFKMEAMCVPLICLWTYTNYTASHHSHHFDNLIQWDTACFCMIGTELLNVMWTSGFKGWNEGVNLYVHFSMIWNCYNSISADQDYAMTQVIVSSLTIPETYVQSQERLWFIV